MDPIVEDLLTRESVALETEAGVPIASPEMTTLTIVTDEPEVPIIDLALSQLDLCLSLLLGKVTID